MLEPGQRGWQVLRSQGQPLQVPLHQEWHPEARLVLRPVLRELCQQVPRQEPANQKLQALQVQFARS